MKFHGDKQNENKHKQIEKICWKINILSEKIIRTKMLFFLFLSLEANTLSMKTLGQKERKKVDEISVMRFINLPGFLEFQSNSMSYLPNPVYILQTQT